MGKQRLNMDKTRKMNAIGLYITTCRYVIQSNPYDADSWSELYKYLPYLRRALACCVCTKLLDIPMGPPENVCQHYVCKACVGGTKRLKPACGWCNNDQDFVENSILRIVIQCFKKLCEYLASSAVVASLSNANNGATTSLMTIIEEGMAVKDNYNSPVSSELGLFPPKLQKVTSRTLAKEEQKEQHPQCPSPRDKGEGQIPGSSFSTKRMSSREEADSTSGTTSEFASETVTCTATSTAPQNENCGDVNENSLPSGTLRGKSGQVTVQDTTKVSKREKRREFYEAVAAEHDYGSGSAHSKESKVVPKVRIRKIEGDHESLVKKPKLMAETVLDDSGTPITKNTENGNPVCASVVSSSSNVTPKSTPGSPLSPIGGGTEKNASFSHSVLGKSHSSVKNNKLSTKKRLSGCRCGMATPNPGKLTCCGQRCPCYSAFKGCVDCCCRGCRNPRGDTPGPMSLKFQLQQQSTMTGPNPQIILQPIKIEQDGLDSDIDID